MFALVLASSGCFGFGVAKVNGETMSPTFHDGDRVLVGAVVSLQRGTVVMVRYPRNPERGFMKRIVALPGERVQVVDGSVVINGKTLDEPYVSPNVVNREMNTSDNVVPAGMFLVMPDKRAGKSWGLVNRAMIFGVVWRQ